MLIPQMAIRFHSQSPTVFVTEPAGDSGDVHARFNAGRLNLSGYCFTENDTFCAMATEC
jgi:hypothetical protein